MSFLVMDIGNTRLKWGIYAGPDPSAQYLYGGAILLEEIDTLAQTHWREIQPAPAAMLGCAVAGEQVKCRVEAQLDYWGLVSNWISPTPFAAGVINGYTHPNRLGADRWAALIGTRHRLLSEVNEKNTSLQSLAKSFTAPAIVVMVGTAVTIDVLDQQGHFCGGIVLPGFGLMLRAMEIGTAGLKVPSGEVCDFPRNTSDALMSGGADAIAGAVERMYVRVVQRFKTEARLFISGGAANKLKPSINYPHEIVENLIFEGILEIASERHSTYTT